MGEGISGGCEALGISDRLAFGMGGKNCVFRASAFSMGVVAVPDGVTRLGIDGGVGGGDFLFLRILLVASCLFFLLQLWPQPA